MLNKTIGKQTNACEGCYTRSENMMTLKENTERKIVIKSGSSVRAKRVDWCEAKRSEMIEPRGVQDCQAEISLDDCRGQMVRCKSLVAAFSALKVIHVVAHGDKQVEEELAAMLHLVLHRAAALECVARADDEGQVVGAQLAIGVGRVGVGVAGGGHDGAALDTRLEALLAESKALELVKTVLLGGAVDDGVLQDHAHTVHIDGGFTLAGILEAPAVPLLVVLQTRVVVALVQVLQHGRENLGLLVGKVDPPGRGVEELALADGLEVRGVAEDILVGGEQALVPANADGDDSRGQSTDGG